MQGGGISASSYKFLRKAETDLKLTENKIYPWLLVVSYSVMGVFFPAAVTQYSMVVGDIAQALAVESRMILAADTVRAICLVVSMFASGLIYKKLGLRKTMLFGMMCQIVPQFLIPLAINAKSLPLLFVFKGLQGVNAMAFPLYISTITLWIEQRFAGLATAIFNGSFVAGSGVGAWLAGRVIPVFGWQASFYVIGGVCAAFAIPAWLITRDKAQPVTEKIKKKGTYGPIIRQPVTWMLIAGLFANTWVSQAITVDMSVYANSLGYAPAETGNLMLAISFVTVISSILAGAVSDNFAAKSHNSVKVRSFIMALGYVLSLVAAVVLPSAAEKGFAVLMLSACAMMFGASWSGGVFWALPVEVYSKDENVAGTAFCSGASNIPNPIAPAVVGVMLGAQGHWTLAWITCAVASGISLAASVMLMTQKKNDN